MRKLLLAFLFALPATAQQGHIEPTWVYTTPIHWERIQGAPRDVKTRYAAATTIVLYPEGQYLEIHASLYREGLGPIEIPGNDGLLIRTGTWSRTDDHAIRIHTREVLEDKILRPMLCHDAAKQHCDPPPDPTLPTPYSYENCTLEGDSSTHLAHAIHCKAATYKPLLLTLDTSSIDARATEGFRLK